MVLENKTKIIATVGPASSSEEIIKELIVSGVNIFRINCSHASSEKIAEYCSLIAKARADLGAISVGTLLDLPGAKIRLNPIINEPITLKGGDTIRLSVGTHNSDMNRLMTASLPNLSFLEKGDRIFLDDGRIELITEDIISENEVLLSTVIGGDIYSGKGIEFPDSDVPVPDLTEKDFQVINLV
ncbi:MAG: pyruvate kinase, partial [Deltaproteobacteria bacterium]|nr:pyruvate kinase [Deltaproteobacteria bacterium]